MSVSIPLTQGKVALVDDEDADLAELRWHAHKPKASKAFYAKRNVRKRDSSWTIQQMHVVIGARMGIGTGQVDHRDRDGLNNVRQNLRPANGSQNTSNQDLRSDNVSGVKGVSWEGRRSMWLARIMVEGKRSHIGYFTHLADAEAAVRAAREKALGEFACHGES
jgi:hypothetical protein